MKFNAFKIGDRFTTKKVTLTKEEIIHFAKQYDPQYFHIDEAAAKSSPYGSLIASGFQTLSVVWSEWIKMDVLGIDCLGGTRADIKWIKPVKPGDELFGVFTVVAKKESSSKKRGLVTFEFNIFNQIEAIVLKGKTNIYLAN